MITNRDDNNNAGSAAPLPCDLGAHRSRARRAHDGFRPARPGRSRRRARRRRPGIHRHDPALHRLRPGRPRFPVHRAEAVDRDVSRQLPPGHRRHIAAADPAQQLHDDPGRARRLAGHPGAGRAVPRFVSLPVGLHERRIRGARRAAVLRLFRSDADPDVRGDRHLGRSEPRLRGVQVLPLYAAGLAPRPDRAHLSVQRLGRELLVLRVVSGAALAERPDSVVPRVLCGVRGEGADVAGSHLAAGRARGGAHRRLGRACRDHAEARRLRLPQAVAAHRPRCEPAPRVVRDRAVADRGGVYRARRARPERHEEADRLLVDLAHGLRHARHLHLQPARHRRRRDPDDLARLRLGRAVPLRGRAVRPAALAHDLRLRRCGEPHARVRRAFHAVRDGQFGPAGNERLRGRVHGHHRRGQGELLVCVRGGDDACLRRGLHAVDVQARHLRRRREPPRRASARTSTCGSSSSSGSSRSPCCGWASIRSLSPKCCTCRSTTSFRT